MTTIFTHLDSDGICSASLVKMVKKYQDASVYFTHPAGLAHDLKDVDDDLIICDIAIDARKCDKIYSRFEKILEQHTITYFDHHYLPKPLPEKINSIHHMHISATEIVYRYFFYDLPKFADHIAVIGGFSDYLDSSDLMHELLLHYERRTLYMDAGLLAQGLKRFSDNKHYDELRKIVIALGRGAFPCDINELTKAALEITKKDKHRLKKILTLYHQERYIAWIRDPPVGSRSKIAHWIMGTSGKYLGIVIRTLNSRRELVDITIRGRQGLKLYKIIPHIAQTLGGSAGGHDRAMGARIPAKNASNFIRLLDRTLNELELPRIKPVEELIKFPDKVEMEK
ncbi:MAG: DHHA1 domain-containing protein [Promethearchaeota archaeon]